MAKKPALKKGGEVTLPFLLKKYPGAGFASEIFSPDKPQLWIPSSSIPLNYQLGGGAAYGKMMEIYGEESSGKTLAAINIAANAQSLGGLVIWDDAEQSFSEKWAKQNGLDLSRILYSNETAIEHISDWAADAVLYARSILVKNEPLVFIGDSLAAWDCLENINSTQTQGKAEMGNRAKAVYKFMRIRNQMFSELGVSSIFINQIRHKLGTTQWEDPDTTPAGKAMRFYASQRLGLYAGKQIKDDVNGVETRVGAWVSVRVKKNKLSPPRPTIKTKVYFNPDYSMPLGFDKYYGLQDILQAIGTIEHRGRSGYYFKGKRIAQSEESMVTALFSDDELRAKLLKSSRIMTMSKAREKIAEIKTNLFKVKSSTYEKHTSTKAEE